MKVKSYIYLDGSLQSVEVEVLSQRGLPQLQFVGLPDQVIKESAVRIKSAIKSSGFEWPQAKQIIVNLKPSHLKKSSRGLEFAVAAAILWETGQLPEESIQFQTAHLYGELDLDGKIYLPEDLKVFYPFEASKEVLYTGQINTNALFWSNESIYQLDTLKDLATPKIQNKIEKPWSFVRPLDFHQIQVCDAQKEWIQLCALGEHHALMAGPSGSGKSLTAEIIHCLRIFPTLEEEISLFSKLTKGDFKKLWRPMVKPHHSITLQGLIGGGLQIQEGEMSRASNGTLIFDELLEFKPQVVEALREPLENGQVRVARSSGVSTFKSDFLWLATTNLCPCGDFTPGKPVECRYSLQKCRSYSQKLSGPLLDRFDMIAFTHQWKGVRKHSVQEILEKLEQNPFFKERENKLQLDQKLESIKLPFIAKKIMDSWAGSIRRKKATMRVAYTLAKLNQRQHIIEQDIEKAMLYTVQPFQSMQRWD